MTRTDRNRLLPLCMLAAALFFTACTQRDSEHVGAADAESPPVIVPELPEVVVTASRIHPDERADEEERRFAARRDR
jgi:hypothetical protein